jgi:23S rRNA pseudouridine1911/1915/1917 synthase
MKKVKKAKRIVKKSKKKALTVKSTEKKGPQEIIVGEEDQGQRLDQYLVGRYPKHSRTFIQKLIKNGDILVNGEKVKTGLHLFNGFKIMVNVPEPVDTEIKGEKLPIDIVYEDKDLLVVNKPAGMVVHPAVGNYSGTLVNALLGKRGKLSSIGGVIRPGIVHRLDKDTSGLLVVAKNDLAHQSLSKQIQEKTAIRKYLAIVYGRVNREEGTIHTAYGRHSRHRQKMAVYELGTEEMKEAITHYKVRQRFRNFTLVECELETGRTHQIRVHMKHLGHTILGDTVYGPKKNDLGVTRQMLHAYSLSFDQPKTGKRLQFEVKPPEDFKAIVDRLAKIGK